MFHYIKLLLTFSVISVFRRPFFRYLRNLKDWKKKINKEGLRSKTVQIFIPVKTPTTDKFRSEISTLCEKFSYECIHCDDIGRLLEKFPLIVVCPISSRFEPDIDYAIYGIHRKFMSYFVLKFERNSKTCQLRNL
jgi:hypothetical protein